MLELETGSLNCLALTSKDKATASPASSIMTERELFLQQQLGSKDEIIAELRSSKAALDAVIASKEAVIESKDALIQSKDAVIQSKTAVIEAKDKLLVKLQEPLLVGDQRPDSFASSGAETAALAERLAVAEACLQQLEAAGGSDGGKTSSLALSDREPKRACCASGHLQPLEKDEVLDEIFSYVGRKERLYVGGACRRWRGRYLSMCYKACASKDEHMHSKQVTAAVL
jgi:hypothetical protein